MVLPHSWSGFEGLGLFTILLKLQRDLGRSSPFTLLLNNELSDDQSL